MVAAHHGRLVCIFLELALLILLSHTPAVASAFSALQKNVRAVSCKLNFTAGAKDPVPFDPACAQQKLLSVYLLQPLDFLSQHALQPITPFPSGWFSRMGSTITAQLSFFAKAESKRPKILQNRKRGTAYSVVQPSADGSSSSIVTRLRLWTVGRQNITAWGTIIRQTNQYDLLSYLTVPVTYDPFAVGSFAPVLFPDSRGNSTIVWNYNTDPKTGQISAINVAVVAPSSPATAYQSEAFLKSSATLKGNCVEVYGPSSYSSLGTSVQFIGIWEPTFGRMQLYAQSTVQARVGFQKSLTVTSAVPLNPNPMAGRCGTVASPAADAARTLFVSVLTDALCAVFDTVSGSLPAASTRSSSSSSSSSGSHKPASSHFPSKGRKTMDDIDSFSTGMHTYVASRETSHMAGREGGSEAGRRIAALQGLSSVSRPSLQHSSSRRVLSSSSSSSARQRVLNSRSGAGWHKGQRWKVFPFLPAGPASSPLPSARVSVAGGVSSPPLSGTFEYDGNQQWIVTLPQLSTTLLPFNITGAQLLQRATDTISPYLTVFLEGSQSSFCRAAFYYDPGPARLTNTFTCQAGTCFFLLRAVSAHLAKLTGIQVPVIPASASPASVLMSTSAKMVADMDAGLLMLAIDVYGSVTMSKLAAAVGLRWSLAPSIVTLSSATIKMVPGSGYQQTDGTPVPPGFTISSQLTVTSLGSRNIPCQLAAGNSTDLSFSLSGPFTPLAAFPAIVSADAVVSMQLNGTLRGSLPLTVGPVAGSQVAASGQLLVSNEWSVLSVASTDRKAAVLLLAVYDDVASAYSMASVPSPSLTPYRANLSTAVLSSVHGTLAASMLLSGSYSISSLVTLLGLEWTLPARFFLLQDPAVYISLPPDASAAPFSSPVFTLSSPALSSPTINLPPGPCKVNVTATDKLTFNITTPFAPLPLYPTVTVTAALLTTQSSSSVSLSGPTTVSLFTLLLGTGTLSVSPSSVVTVDVTSTDPAGLSFLASALPATVTFPAARLFAQAQRRAEVAGGAGALETTRTRAVFDSSQGPRYISVQVLGTFLIGDLTSSLGIPWPLAPDLIQLSNASLTYVASPGYDLNNIGTLLPAMFALTYPLTLPLLNVSLLPCRMTFPSASSVGFNITGSFFPLSSYPSVVATSASLTSSSSSMLPSDAFTGTLSLTLPYATSASGFVSLANSSFTLNLTTVDTRALSLLQVVASDVQLFTLAPFPPLSSSCNLSSIRATSAQAFFESPSSLRFLSLSLSSSLSLSQLSSILGLRWSLPPSIFTLSSPSFQLLPSSGFSPSPSSDPLSPGLLITGFLSSPLLSLSLAPCTITVNAQGQLTMNFTGSFVPLPAYPRISGSSGYLALRRLDGSSLSGTFTAVVSGMPAAGFPASWSINNTANNAVTPLVAVTMDSADVQAFTLLNVISNDVAGAYSTPIAFPTADNSTFRAASSSLTLTNKAGLLYAGLTLSGSYYISALAPMLGVDWSMDGRLFALTNPVIEYVPPSGSTLPNGTFLASSFTIRTDLTSSLLGLSTSPAVVTVRSPTNVTFSIPSPFTPLPLYPNTTVSQATLTTSPSLGLSGPISSSLFSAVAANGTLTVSPSSSVTLSIVSTDVQGLLILKFSAPQVPSLAPLLNQILPAGVVPPLPPSSTTTTKAVLDSSLGLRYLAVQLPGSFAIGQLAYSLGIASWPSSLSPSMLQLSNVSLVYVAPPGLTGSDGVLLSPTLAFTFPLSLPLMNITRLPARMTLPSPSLLTFDITGSFTPLSSYPLLTGTYANLQSSSGGGGGGSNTEDSFTGSLSLWLPGQVPASGAITLLNSSLSANVTTTQPRGLSVLNVVARDVAAFTGAATSAVAPLASASLSSLASSSVQAIFNSSTGLRYLSLQFASSLSMAQLSNLLGFRWNLLPSFLLANASLQLVPSPGYSPSFSTFLAPSLTVRSLFSSPSLSYAASDTILTVRSNTLLTLNISGPFAPLPSYPSILASSANLQTQADGSLAGGVVTVGLYSTAVASGTMALSNASISLNLTSSDAASGVLIRAASAQLASAYGARFMSTLASDFIATSASAAIDSLAGVRFFGVNFTGSYTLVDFCSGLGLQWWFGATDFQALNPAVYFATQAGYSFLNSPPLSFPSYSTYFTLSSPLLSITRLPATISVSSYDSLTLSLSSSFSPLSPYPSWVVTQAVLTTYGASGLAGTVQSVVSGQLRASGSMNVSLSSVVTLNVTSVDAQGIYLFRLAAPQIYSLYGVTIPPTNSNVVDPPTTSSAAVFSNTQGPLYISTYFSNPMPIATLTNALGLTWSLNAYLFQLYNVSLQFVPPSGYTLPSGSVLSPTLSSSFYLSAPLLNLVRIPARMDIFSPTNYTFGVTGKFLPLSSFPNMTSSSGSLTASSVMVTGTLQLSIFAQLQIPANLTVTTDAVTVDVTTTSYKGMLLLGLGADNLTAYNGVVLPQRDNFITPRTTYTRAVFDSNYGLRFFSAQLQLPLTYGQFAGYFGLQWAFNASLFSVAGGASVQLVLPPGYRVPSTTPYLSPSFTVTSTSLTLPLLSISSPLATITIGSPTFVTVSITGSFSPFTAVTSCSFSTPMTSPIAGSVSANLTGGVSATLYGAVAAAGSVMITTSDAVTVDLVGTDEGSFAAVTGADASAAIAALTGLNTVHFTASTASYLRVVFDRSTGSYSLRYLLIQLTPVYTIGTFFSRLYLTYPPSLNASMITVENGAYLQVVPSPGYTFVNGTTVAAGMTGQAALTSSFFNFASIATTFTIVSSTKVTMALNSSFAPLPAYPTLIASSSSFLFLPTVVNGTFQATGAGASVGSGKLTVFSDSFYLDVTSSSSQGLNILPLLSSDLSGFITPSCSPPISSLTTLSASSTSIRFLSTTGFASFIATLTDTFTIGTFAPYLNVSWSLPATLLSLNTITLYITRSTGPWTDRWTVYPLGFGGRAAVSVPFLNVTSADCMFSVQASDAMRFDLSSSQTLPKYSVITYSAPSFAVKGASMTAAVTCQVAGLLTHAANLSLTSSRYTLDMAVTSSTQAWVFLSVVSADIKSLTGITIPAYSAGSAPSTVTYVAHFDSSYGLRYLLLSFNSVFLTISQLNTLLNLNLPLALVTFNCTVTTLRLVPVGGYAPPSDPSNTYAAGLTIASTFAFAGFTSLTGTMTVLASGSVTLAVPATQCMPNASCSATTLTSSSIVGLSGSVSATLFDNIAGTGTFYITGASRSVDITSSDSTNTMLLLRLVSSTVATYSPLNVSTASGSKVSSARVVMDLQYGIRYLRMQFTNSLPITDYLAIVAPSFAWPLSSSLILVSGSAIQVVPSPGYTFPGGSFFSASVSTSASSVSIPTLSISSASATFSFSSPSTFNFTISPAYIPLTGYPGLKLSSTVFQADSTTLQGRSAASTFLTSTNTTVTFTFAYVYFSSPPSSTFRIDVTSSPSQIAAFLTVVAANITTLQASFYVPSYSTLQALSSTTFSARFLSTTGLQYISFPLSSITTITSLAQSLNATWTMDPSLLVVQLSSVVAVIAPQAGAWLLGRPEIPVGFGGVFLLTLPLLNVVAVDTVFSLPSSDYFTLSLSSSFTPFPSHSSLSASSLFLNSSLPGYLSGSMDFSVSGSAFPSSSLLLTNTSGTLTSSPLTPSLGFSLLSLLSSDIQTLSGVTLSPPSDAAIQSQLTATSASLVFDATAVRSLTLSLSGAFNFSTLATLLSLSWPYADPSLVQVSAVTLIVAKSAVYSSTNQLLFSPGFGGLATLAIPSASMVGLPGSFVITGGGTVTFSQTDNSSSTPFAQYPIAVSNAQLASYSDGLQGTVTVTIFTTTLVTSGNLGIISPSFTLSISTSEDVGFLFLRAVSPDISSSTGITIPSSAVSTPVTSETDAIFDGQTGIRVLTVFLASNTTFGDLAAPLGVSWNLPSSLFTLSSTKIQFQNQGLSVFARLACSYMGGVTPYYELGLTSPSSILFSAMESFTPLTALYPSLKLSSLSFSSSSSSSSMSGTANFLITSTPLRGSAIVIFYSTYAEFNVSSSQTSGLVLFDSAADAGQWPYDTSAFSSPSVTASSYSGAPSSSLSAVFDTSSGLRYADASLTGTYTIGSAAQSFLRQTWSGYDSLFSLSTVTLVLVPSPGWSGLLAGLTASATLTFPSLGASSLSSSLSLNSSTSFSLSLSGSFSTPSFPDLSFSNPTFSAASSVLTAASPSATVTLSTYPVSSFSLSQGAGESYATGAVDLGPSALAAVTSSLLSQLQAKIGAMSTDTSSTTVAAQTVGTSDCPGDLTSAYDTWDSAFTSLFHGQLAQVQRKAQDFYDAMSADLAGTTNVSSAMVSLFMDAVTPSYNGSFVLVLYGETFTLPLSTVSGVDVQAGIVDAVVSGAVTLLLGMFPLLGTYGFS